MYMGSLQKASVAHEIPHSSWAAYSFNPDPSTAYTSAGLLLLDCKLSWRPPLLAALLPDLEPLHPEQSRECPRVFSFAWHILSLTLPVGHPCVVLLFLIHSVSSMLAE